MSALGRPTLVKDTAIRTLFAQWIKKAGLCTAWIKKKNQFI
jgi:hypothetical protein